MESVGHNNLYDDSKSFHIPETATQLGKKKLDYNNMLNINNNQNQSIKNIKAKLPYFLMIRFFFLNIGVSDMQILHCNIYCNYYIRYDKNVNTIFVTVFWMPNKLISRSYIVTFNEMQA